MPSGKSEIQGHSFCLCYFIDTARIASAGVRMKGVQLPAGGGAAGQWNDQKSVRPIPHTLLMSAGVLLAAQSHPLAHADDWPAVVPLGLLANLAPALA